MLTLWYLVRSNSWAEALVEALGEGLVPAPVLAEVANDRIGLGSN